MAGADARAGRGQTAGVSPDLLLLVCVRAMQALPGRGCGFGIPLSSGLGGTMWLNKTTYAILCLCAGLGTLVGRASRARCQLLDSDLIYLLCSQIVR